MGKENNKNKTNNCSGCRKSCYKQDYVYRVDKGLSELIVRQISQEKCEPDWMLERRIKAFMAFDSKKMQAWGPDLGKLDLRELYFYLKAFGKQEASWEDVPVEIRKPFEEENIQSIEQESLAGLGAQYESEVVYHNLKKEWEDLGVIFCDTDTALKKYSELFKEYFGTVVPFDDNKFASLNSAVWSGGSFIYVPKNVNVKVPLQAYYKMDSKKLGQFERTLIIADENSSVSYIEGCTARSYSDNSLHSAVVEIVAKKGARVKYYTIQNWSSNVYNLVTKRAHAYQDSFIEWIDCNVGSGVTMKYPAVVLKEKGARTSVWSLSVAGKEQIQDTGAKAVHLAEKTTSNIVSKSISSNGGRASYRGFIKVAKNAKNSKSFVQCDGLMLDGKSRSDAYPYMDIAQKEVDIGHEARVSKIVDEQIFYLMSRGLNHEEAQTLVINGFIQPFVKELPVEYALEVDRLLSMGIKGEL